MRRKSIRKKSCLLHNNKTIYYKNKEIIDKTHQCDSKFLLIKIKETKDVNKTIDNP